MEESGQHCPNTGFWFLFLFPYRCLNGGKGFTYGEHLKIWLKTL